MNYNLILKEDQFEKFYIVCQKYKSENNSEWFSCEQQIYKDFEDANKLFSSLVSSDKSKEFDFKIVEYIVESQTINDTLGEMFSIERLHDPYTIKNHIDIKWHYDKDGERPELDTSYIIKTKKKDGYIKYYIAKYVSLEDINMFVSLDDNEVIADNVIAWCSISNISSYLDVDSDIRIYRKQIDENYKH